MKWCMGCMAEIGEETKICPHCGYAKNTRVKEAYYLSPETMLHDRYIVGRVLGYGGFGVTYIGYDTVIGSVTAIKEYFPSDFATRGLGSKRMTIYPGDAQIQYQSGLESFISEARKLARFTETPGIVDIYDCFLENDTGYIVMEYLRGKTVKEILKEKERFSYEEAERIILRVLDGLAAVHKEGIIHRDVAPDNIFITDNGAVKLLDFGAARYAASIYSRSLSVILKPGYAPEEQYRSRGQQGSWTDVYGAGATFYRMITGVRPEESLERMLEDTLEAPSKLGVQIPPEKEAVLMKSLAVRRVNRIQTAEEFKNLLAPPRDPVTMIPGTDKAAPKNVEKSSAKSSEKPEAGKAEPKAATSAAGKSAPKDTEKAAVRPVSKSTEKAPGKPEPNSTEEATGKSAPKNGAKAPEKAGGSPLKIVAALGILLGIALIAWAVWGGGSHEEPADSAAVVETESETVTETDSESEVITEPESESEKITETESESETASETEAVTETEQVTEEAETEAPEEDSFLDADSVAQFEGEWEQYYDGFSMPLSEDDSDAAPARALIKDGEVHWYGQNELVLKCHINDSGALVDEEGQLLVNLLKEDKDRLYGTVWDGSNGYDIVAMRRVKDSVSDAQWFGNEEEESELKNETEPETELKAQTDPAQTSEDSAESSADDSVAVLVTDDTCGTYVVTSAEAYLDPEEMSQEETILLPEKACVYVSVSEEKEDGIWRKAIYAGMEGWIKSDDLTLLSKEDLSIKSGDTCYANTTPGSSDDLLKIYENPSENSEIVATTKYGEEFVVEDLADNWAKVTLAGKVGWVQMNQIAKFMPECYYYATAGSGLRMRQLPDTSATAVGTLYIGNTVKLTECVNGWGRVQEEDEETSSGGSEVSEGKWVAMKYMTPCMEADGGKQFETEAPAPTYTAPSYSYSGGSSSSGSKKSSGGSKKSSGGGFSVADIGSF